MDTKLSFGRWVKQQRKALDLTQHELAQHIDYALSTVQKIELDQRRPSRQLAELLADHLDLAPHQRDSFLSLARTQPASSPSILTSAPAPRRPFQNLPSPLTSLVGREWEVATLCTCLLQEGVRLLTITGPPGVGKTRLSLQVAAQLRQRFPDGVCFVALASISDARFVISAIAHALGVKDTGGKPLVEQVVEHLCDQHFLLVLDNFEHVLSAAPLVTKLLEGLSSLKILVTSRANLQIYGEHEFVAPCLALPDLTQCLLPDQLLQCATVALFVQRARAVRPEFTLDDRNALAVAAICVRLEGIPLAIELAAARSKVFAPQSLLIRLTGALAAPFELLAGSTHLPARHRALRSAIAWSYELLNPAEQAVFRCLGVFAGACMVHVAGVVMRAQISGTHEQSSQGSDHGPLTPDNWLLQTLHSLVNQSLVIQQQEPDGEPRFTQLEMIREFALEQLEQRGETEAVCYAHALCFLQLAESFSTADVEGKAPEVQSAMEREIDNLRAGLRWATAHDLELELRLTTAMLNFWSSRRHLGEGREWLEHLLPRLKAALPKLSLQHMAQYAEIHFMLAFFVWQQGDYTLAKVQLEENIALSRELRDWQHLGASLNILALTFYNLGDVAAAYTPSTESVAILRNLSKPWELALSLITLGRITSARGDFATAHTLHAEALTIFRKIGDVWGGNFGLLRFSEVLFAQGDDAGARTLLEDVLPTFREEEQTWFVAQTLLALGKVHWRQGDKVQALALWDESVHLSREVGAKESLSGSLLMLGWATQERGELQQAKTLFAESLGLYQAMGHKTGTAYALSALAGLIEQSERATKLLGVAAVVLDTARTPMDQLERAHYEATMAAVRAQLGEAAFAVAWAEGQAMSLEQAIQYALA